MMLIQTDGLTITQDGQQIDIRDDLRTNTGLPFAHLRIGQTQANGLYRALRAVCDRTVGEIEAEIECPDWDGKIERV